VRNKNHPGPLLQALGFRTTDKITKTETARRGNRAARTTGPQDGQDENETNWNNNHRIVNSPDFLEANRKWILYLSMKEEAFWEGWAS